MAILVKSSTLLIIVLTKRQRILNTPYQATKLPSYQATEFRCDDEKNNWRSCKRG
jgi:hypothetical protein